MDSTQWGGQQQASAKLLAGEGRMSQGMPPYTNTKWVSMVTTADPTHFMSHRPLPPLNACPTSMSTGGWRVCSLHPYFNINSNPPLAPCHIALAIHPKDHHPMQQKIWHFIPFLGIPWSSFTGIKISQDSQHPPWSPATLWLWNSQETMACLFLTLPEALRFTHFISLPPSPLYLESYCCHVLSFFLFTLSLSSSASLYPKSVTPQCLATFQLF